MAHRNRDPPLPLLRRVVDRPKIPHRHRPDLRVQHLRDRRRQRRLPVIDVPNRPHVHVRLRPIKLLLGHPASLLRSATNLFAGGGVTPPVPTLSSGSGHRPCRRPGNEHVTYTPDESWSPCPGLNRRPRPYQGRALPTELHGPVLQPSCPLAKRVRTNGWSGKRDSNPRPPAWKAGALPLSYSRVPYPASSRRPGRWWGEEDLNPRRRPPADLQSAPFGHLGISPLAPRAVTL